MKFDADKILKQRFARVAKNSIGKFLGRHQASPDCDAAPPSGVSSLNLRPASAGPFLDEDS